MTRLLVVNHALSHVCGIHDLGLRIHRCLAASDKLDVDYAACADATEFQAAADGYDAVIVNHRDDLTPWAATSTIPSHRRYVMRTIDHSDNHAARHRAASIAAAEDEIRDLLLWRSVTKVTDDTLELDDGTRLTLYGNEGCGGCANGHYPLVELNGAPNAITAVEFDTDDDEMAFRIFVYAEDQRIKLAEFRAEADNGYYGSGYWIDVELPPGQQ